MGALSGGMRKVLSSLAMPCLSVVPAGFDLARRAVGLDYAVPPQVEEDERVQRRDGCGHVRTRFESNSAMTVIETVHAKKICQLFPSKSKSRR